MVAGCLLKLVFPDAVDWVWSFSRLPLIAGRFRSNRPLFRYAHLKIPQVLAVDFFNWVVILESKITNLKGTGSR